MTMMFKKNLILICSVVVLLAFFLSGCGKKGPPRPPVKETVDQNIKGAGSPNDQISLTKDFLRVCQC